MYLWALFGIFKNFQSPHETKTLAKLREANHFSINLEEMTIFFFKLLGNLHSLSLAFFQFYLETKHVRPNA